MDYAGRSMGIRVLRALLAGGSAFLFTYLIPSYVFPEEALGATSSTVIFFSGICVFFSAAGELTKGTLAYFLLDIVRGFTMIYFFGSTSSAGGISFQVPMGNTLAYVNIDLSVLTLIVIALSLFDIARTLVKAVHYYIKKRETEEIMRLFQAYVREAGRRR